MCETYAARGRDEARAEQGALLEEMILHPVYIDLKGCSCGYQFPPNMGWYAAWQQHIRSLATAPMQAALKRQQASVAADRQQILTILDEMIPADAPQDDRVFVAYQRIGALPVNEAALEKVKAEAKVEAQFDEVRRAIGILCDADADGSGVVGASDKLSERFTELSQLRRDAEKQTP